MRQIFRCRCNAVSIPWIATHPEDYKYMKFHPAPNDPNEMICDDCFQAEEEINSEWMDDVVDEEFSLDDEEADDLWDDEDDD